MSSSAKWKDKGYWVSHHFYWQSLIHYFIGSVRFRSFTFFAACDPAIDLGGMLDENKSDIYDLLPAKYVPATIKVRIGDDYLSRIRQLNLDFPLIVKPNIGFRGYKVAKVDDAAQLEEFLKDQDPSREWLIQEYIDFKNEYSLLYYRIPENKKSGITSLIEKVYPFVRGDGVHTLGALIQDYPNPFIDKEQIQKKISSKEREGIPVEGDKIILDTIGNYSRGSKFHSLENQIDKKLVKATNDHFREIEGLDFFRMDFKADSLEEYIRGNFGILEINGAKSEPLHIYDPRYSFVDRFRDIKDHWAIITKVVKARLKGGSYRLPSTAYGLRSFFAIKKLVK